MPLRDSRRHANGKPGIAAFVGERTNSAPVHMIVRLIPLAPHPPRDVHLKRSSGQNRAALLLMKPRCLLDEVGNRLFGHGQSCRARRSP
jgi:hypothetical protein